MFVRFDARPYIAHGDDPLDAIQSAWSELPAGSTLAVCAPFEPRPLMMLYSSRGIGVRTQSSEPGVHWLFIGPKPC